MTDATPVPGSRAKELAGYSFLVVFANDRTIDDAELAMLERLALEDGVVDDAEREVLGNIFGRVTPEQVAETVRAEIERFRERHAIP
jgi:hypothetical protein